MYKGENHTMLTRPSSKLAIVLAACYIGSGPAAFIHRHHQGFSCLPSPQQGYM
jgi:hypothetical protein